MSQKRRTERILIVDDTSSNLVLLNEILCGAGYVVSVATNGLDALESTRLAPPDMVLLDILMPGMDGYEVLASLKKDPATKSIPVLLLSALGETESKTKGFQLGACDYITKPFHLMEVLARMDTHLRVASLERRLRWSEGAMREGERIARIGTWTRDLQSGQIEWSDELFALLGSERTAGRSIVGILEDVVFSDDLRAVKALFTDPVSSLDGGKVSEFRLNADGERGRTMRATGKRIDDAKTGGKSVFIGVMQDITQIRNDHEVDRSRQRVADRILEGHPDGILYLDRDGKIVQVNDSFLHLVGRRSEDVVGSVVDGIGMMDADGSRLSDDIRRALISGTQRIRVKLSAASGRVDAEMALISVDDTGASVVLFVRALPDDGIVG